MAYIMPICSANMGKSEQTIINTDILLKLYTRKRGVEISKNEISAPLLPLRDAIIN